MTVPSRPTNENVQWWILQILADYDGRFTPDGDTVADEAIWIRGPKGSFIVSREVWDDDRAGFDRTLRSWADLAF
jgi:hypothetical protein